MFLFFSLMFAAGFAMSFSYFSEEESPDPEAGADTIDEMEAEKNQDEDTSIVEISGADIESGLDIDHAENTQVGTNGNETLVGGNTDDFLAGKAGSDALLGHAGNDVLVGGGGDDALHGRAGSDLLLGGAGEDTLIGGLGDDTLDGFDDRKDFLVGGDGNDVILVGQGDQAYGGLGEDTFLIDSENESRSRDAQSVTEIIDFNKDQDILFLYVQPDQAYAEPSINVSESDPSKSQLQFNGQTLATLRTEDAPDPKDIGILVKDTSRA